MKNLKRFGALALALVLALSALTGCGQKGPGSSSSTGSSSGSGSGSEDLSQTAPMDLSEVTDPYLAAAGISGDTVVARLGGEDIFAAELLYWLNRNTKTYLDQFGGMVDTPPWTAELDTGVTVADQMKEGAMDAALFYRSLYQLGKGENLTPDASAASTVDKEYTDLMLQMGDESVVQHMYWAQMLSRELLVYLNECFDLYGQLQQLYYGEDSESYPTDAEVMSWLDQGGYFRVKHILLMTIDQVTNDPLDEAVIAEKKATAEDLLAQLRAAEDPISLFDQLMKEYSEDGGLATNPDGYIFNAEDSLVGGFREATLELSVGEISDVVETDYGFHIMLRLPIDPADYRSSVISQGMKERCRQWQEEKGVEKTAAYDQIDPADFWTKLTSLQSTVQAEIQAASSKNG